ncbi:MAG: hypothetical protein KFF46_05535 [Desulfobacterales bacterium]|nr:hypothetical protein [Desulfobacterales bacterium]
MEKIRKLLGLGVIVSVLAIWAIAGCGGEQEERQSAKLPDAAEALPLLEQVPENTQVLVKFEGLEELYAQFAVTQNSVLGVSVEQKDIDRMNTALGFNLLNLQEVGQAGFDPAKPICLAVSNIRVNAAETRQTDFDILALLPVSDGEAAMNTLRAALEKENVVVAEAEKNGRSYLKWRYPEAEGAMAVKDEYLYMAVNSDNDPQAFLDSAMENNASLADAEAFQEVAADTDFTRGLAAYFNIADIVEANAEQIGQAAAGGSDSAAETRQMIQSLKQYSAGTMTADFGSPDFTLDTIVSLVPDADIKKVWSPDRINRDKVLGIADPAALLLSFGADMMQYYEMITDIMPPEQFASVAGRMQEFKQNSGIDPETELLGNLSGSMNLALYDGASITLMNYNALFTAGVKDERVMENVIEKFIKVLPPDKQAMISRREVGGTDAYVINAGFTQVYMGIDDNKFIIASGKPLYEKALGGKKDQGFAANLVDDQLKRSIMGQRNLFYLNMDEVVKTVNNFAMFLMESAGGEQKFRERLHAAGKFNYVLATSELEKDLVKSMFTIKTRFTEPFFVETARMVDDLQQ